MRPSHCTCTDCPPPPPSEPRFLVRNKSTSGAASAKQTLGRKRVAPANGPLPTRMTLENLSWRRMGEKSTVKRMDNRWGEEYKARFLSCMVLLCGAPCIGWVAHPSQQRGKKLLEGGTEGAWGAWAVEHIYNHADLGAVAEGCGARAVGSAHRGNSIIYYILYGDCGGEREMEKEKRSGGTNRGRGKPTAPKPGTNVTKTRLKQQSIAASSLVSCIVSRNDTVMVRRFGRWRPRAPPLGRGPLTSPGHRAPWGSGDGETAPWGGGVRARWVWKKECVNGTLGIGSGNCW